MILTKCPNCGKENLDENKFCPNCGANLEEQFDYYPINDEPASTPWWKTLITAICLFISPITIIGIALMWVWKIPAQKKWRIAATIFFSIYLLYSIFSNDVEISDSDSQASTERTDVASETTDGSQKMTYEDISTPIDTILYNDNGCVVTYKGIEKNSSGVVVKLSFENNSNNNLEFYNTAYSVNGIMINDFFASSCEVAKGKKANMKLDLDLSLSDEIKIDKVKNVSFTLDAFDNNESFSSRLFTTGVLQIGTDLDNGTNASINGSTIYDDNGIRLDLISSSNRKYKFSLTNSSGKYVEFDIVNLSVDNYTDSDDSYQVISEPVFDDCQYTFSLEISDDFMTENDIEKIEDVEFSLRIRPDNDITKEYVTEIIKL